MRQATWSALICASLLLIAGAAVSQAQGAEACSTTGPLVCISAASTPEDVVSPSRDESPTYISYHMVASNRATNTVTHAALVATLPSGSSFDSATSDVGSCTGGGVSASCQFGSLARNAVATVDIVVKAPENEGDAVARFTVSYDERSNDGGSQDPK